MTLLALRLALAKRRKFQLGTAENEPVPYWLVAMLDATAKLSDSPFPLFNRQFHSG